jgi:hypothetical protein
MYSVCQSRKIQHVKRNAIIGFRDVAGMMTVSAEKLKANKQKQCQQLAPRKHKPDGTALILLSLNFRKPIHQTAQDFTSKQKSRRMPII